MSYIGLRQLKELNVVLKLSIEGHSIHAGDCNEDY